MYRWTALRTFIGITGIALILIVTSTPAIPQSAKGPEPQKPVWTDPDTKLMWAAKDNGDAPPTYGLLSQKAATAYCRNLALAGFHDWRLPTIEELEHIYDKSVEGYHVKGGVIKPSGDPTGNDNHMYAMMHVWSQSEREDAEGIWEFDFGYGDKATTVGGGGLARALCVRGAPAKKPAAKPNSPVDLSQFVAPDGISIPEGASGAARGSGLLLTTVEGMEMSMILQGKPALATLKYTGTMAASSSGKLGGGTEKFKPTQIQTSKQSDKWLRVASFSLDKLGFLIVTDESGAKYRIKVAPAPNYFGEIEEITSGAR